MDFIKLIFAFIIGAATSIAINRYNANMEKDRKAYKICSIDHTSKRFSYRSEIFEDIEYDVVLNENEKLDSRLYEINNIVEYLTHESDDRLNVILRIKGINIPYKNIHVGSKKI